MSVTSKTIISGTGIILVAKGSVSGDKTTISFAWNGISALYSPWVNGTACPFTLKIDGVIKSLSWTVTKTENWLNSTRVIEATSSPLTVNSPFFKIEFNDNSEKGHTHTVVFSFYDIEKAPTNVKGNEVTIDGVAASTAEFSNYLGEKSEDGSLQITWSLGSHSYTKTVRNVYSASYIIPASWLDAISNASSLSAGGKISVNIIYGTKVYKTLTCTFTCKVSETFLPTISSVTLADKTNTPVPSSWRNVFIQNQSGLRILAIACAASQGATVKKIKLALDDQYVEQAYSTSSLPTIQTISKSGSLQCAVTITDSRNRTCTKTCTVNVIPYDIPRFSLIESNRSTKSGEVDNDGTYFLSETAVEYSTCTGLNTVSITVRYKKTDTSSWGTAKIIKPGTNVCGGDLNTEFSYDVEYVLRDAFSTITYIDYVSTAIYLMHFLHGGRGVAFGQKATLENTLDCAFKALFRDDVTITKQDGTQVSLRQVLEKVGL